MTKAGLYYLQELNLDSLCMFNKYEYVCIISDVSNFCVNVEVPIDMAALIMCFTGGADFVTDITAALLSGYFMCGTVDHITLVAVVCILQFCH